MFDLKKIKNAIASLGSEQRKLTNQVEQMKQKREELLALPRSKEDLATVIDDWMVQQRDVFLARLKQNINFLISSPDAKPNNDLSIFSARDVFGNSVSQDGLLLGLLGPLIRDQLKQSILDMPEYPEETGAPWAQRAAEITKLDKQISGLEGKIEDLKTSAASAGIQLEPPVPPVQPDYSGGEPVNPESRQKAFEKVNKK